MVSVGEGERLAVDEEDGRRAVGERPGADFRSGKILQHRDVQAEVGGDRAHVGDHRGVLVVRPVREIQPRHVDAR